MYSTCLFCNLGLGANEVVEAFPVGRRLAFDQARGRLWVVFRKCEKWNLTPLEERWEAIETCERLFHDTRKRMSTDNIGLARLPEGLELIRIGNPLRPEFAAWRYGDQFGKRFRRSVIGIGAGGVLTGALPGAGIAGLTLGVALTAGWTMTYIGRDILRERRVIAQIPDDSGAVHSLRGSDALHSSIVPGEERYSWALQLRLGSRRRELLVRGDEARRIAAKVVPHINKVGGFKRQVAEAVKHIEESGGAEAYLRWVARYHKEAWVVRRQWLGVEMAVNEENERRALEDELALLELAWKDAEEIAAIADKLVLSPEVEIALRELKREPKRD